MQTTLTTSLDMKAEKASARGLAALCEHYDLDVIQMGQLNDLLSLLAEDERAPTTVRAPAQALGVHLADSLSALEVASVRTAKSVADLGSGAGFPGLPLAIALPSAKIHLVESQARKCAFIEHAIVAAKLENAQTAAHRAEDWVQGIGSHDVVLARALASQPVVLEYAAPLMLMGGSLVDWRGRRDRSEEQAARNAADILGLELLDIYRTEPFAGARDHHLHLYRKVRETPELFPRRPGMARKRPLGTPKANRTRPESSTAVSDLRPRSTLACQ